MEARELLLRSLTESQGFITGALEGLTAGEFARAPGAASNSLAFLYWHLIRVEDLWVNRVIRQAEELYESGGWREKLGTPAGESGYKYTPAQLKAWPVPELAVLRGYAAAVREPTLALLNSPGIDLDRAVAHRGTEDTAGVILTHLVTEFALHAGQMAYIRGLLRGMDTPDTRYW